MRAWPVLALCFSPFFASAAEPEPQLILQAGGLHTYSRGRWSERATNDQLRGTEVYLIDENTLAMQNGDSAWSALRFDSGLIEPLAVLDTLEGAREHGVLPVHLSKTGTLYTSVIKFDRLPLYALRAGETAKAVQNKQGVGDYEFLPDDSYLYVERRGMGRQESFHFSDMIVGQTMTLFRVDGRGAKEALLEVPGLNTPRFADEGTLILYWKPGRVDEKKNRKSWILERLDLRTRETKELAEYEDLLFIGQATSLRFPPAWFSWSSSPWVVIPERSGENRKMIILNVRSGERHEFRVPPGWELVPRIDGQARLPSLIVCRSAQGMDQPSARTVRVVSVPHLEKLLETKTSAKIGRVARGAFVVE
jgi:hypothetical protein